MIIQLLRDIFDTFRGIGSKGADSNKTASDKRHDTIETCLDKYGRLLTMIPFIIILAVSSTNMPAAIWSAFGISIALFLLDFYRSRYNHLVIFPNIIQTTLVLAYVLIIILYYVEKPPLASHYVGPIMMSMITGAMIISIVIMFPFTLQYSGPHVDDTVRKSPAFFRLNQILSVFWAVMMGGGTACAWASLKYAANSAGQIVLGIVMPIVFPIAAQLLTPLIVDYLKRNAKGGSEKKSDEEAALLGQDDEVETASAAGQNNTGLEEEQQDEEDGVQRA